MPHGHIDVRYVANLARLALEEDEVHTFQAQLDSILSYVDELKAVDVSDIEGLAHPAQVFGPMRDDEPKPSLAPELVLQNAPDQAQGQIRVPKVVTDA